MKYLYISSPLPNDHGSDKKEWFESIKTTVQSKKEKWYFAGGTVLPNKVL
jgi:hypothetical protein